MGTIGERLREERDRLGLNQTAFAEAGGVQKRAQINYEKDERQPDAAYLAAISAAGVDVLYVLTGVRQKSNVSTSTYLVEEEHSNQEGLIDVERLSKIAEMLDAAAKQAGKRWPAHRLTTLAAEVYNALADQPTIEDVTIGRVLKLVVNR